MNWLPLAIAAWVLFGLDLGVADLIQQRAGGAAMQPSFIMPLAVFVALGAPHTHAVWTCLFLGLLVDLTRPRYVGATHADLVVIGPHALGYLLAAQLVLTLRSVVIRRNPLTMGVLSALASLVCGLVVATAFTVRSLFGDPVEWDTWRELLGLAGSSLYTGLVAVPLGWILIRLSPAFGLNLGHRHIPSRAYERR